MSPEVDWPFGWDGIVESVTATRQPDGSWAVAALGIHPDDGARRARTWGDTRTRRNLEREGRGYVHLSVDPVTFVRAALESWSRSDPILPDAAAWIEVDATRVDDGRDGGTVWVDWSLRPVQTVVRERAVPVPERARAAVIEATVAASRLDVPGYDADRLRERLAYHAAVARRCGGVAERDAIRRVERLVDGIDQPGGGEPA